ncbi:MAG: hypothetical protein COS89_05955 [Deltaproteobacteria bacterium CG07_land_8_20_14_0_80_38_7]|nr:MAG: hypothetical protein COS89_05955 [Deltaproteobacteria bacterium CG07_land_8_20_14_0_80_38_7]
MNKSRKNILLKGSILLGVLVVFAFLLYQSSDTQRVKALNLNSPTSNKFEMVKKWIPDNTDFLVVSDIVRLKNIPSLMNFFEQSLFKGTDTTIEAISELLGKKSILSMLVMSANFKEDGSSFLFNVIAQGDFHKNNFISYIKDELSKKKISLLSEDIVGVKVYYQKDETNDDPFAFALPDGIHLIVGTKKSLNELLNTGRGTLPVTSANFAFFGYLRSSPVINKILPPQIAMFEMANFYSDDNAIIHFTVMLPDSVQANNLQVFLQGMKALYILQAEGNKALIESMDSILVTVNDRQAFVDAPFELLLKITAR